MFSQFSALESFPFTTAEQASVELVDNLSDMTGGTSQFAQESLGTWTTDMLFCNVCERIYMSARFSILRFLGPLLLPSTSCSGYPSLRFKTNDRMRESATVQQLISFKNNPLLI